MAERKQGDQGDQGTGNRSSVITQTKPKTQKPSMYRVLLLNDDYTTMEFVIEVLERFFRKTKEEAMQITLKVHQEGRGLAGIYPGDIAETKVAQVHEAARTRGFPLRCTAEPA